MSHNRKMTPEEAETVQEFALFIRWAARANGPASVALSACIAQGADGFDCGADRCGQV